MFQFNTVEEVIEDLKNGKIIGKNAIKSEKKYVF